MTTPNALMVYSYDKLDGEILGLIGGAAIEKVPTLEGAIMINNFYRPRDGQTTLGLDVTESGGIEVKRNDGEGISIDYYKKESGFITVRHVLARPVTTLAFSRLPYSQSWALADPQEVLSWEGLESFARLVGEKALQHQSTVFVTEYKDGKPVSVTGGL